MNVDNGFGIHARPSLTFVLLPSGSETETRRFIDSVLNPDEIDVDVVVVTEQNQAAAWRPFPAGVSIRPLEAAESVAHAVNSVAENSHSDFVSILRPRGTVVPTGLDVFARFAAEHPLAVVIYADEAVSGPLGRRTSVAKPIYSPERLRCQFYLGDLIFFARSAFLALGGLDENLPGAELYDVVLRTARAAARAADASADDASAGEVIQRVDAELYLRPAHSPFIEQLDADALESTRRALEEHLSATGGGIVRSMDARGVHDTRRLVTGDPLISIVIPTRAIFANVDGAPRCFVLDAVKSIMELSTYQNFELVLVVDSVADKEVLHELETLAGDRLRLVQWDKPFNFSDKVNLGVLHALGDYVLLLNDDVQVLTPDWLEALLALAQRPGAGMVGAMLYYEDDTIQHAGHAYWDGDASHIGLDVPRGDAGPFDGFLVEREVVGVTAACALMPTAVFHEAGGLTNLLPGNFNDVDLCMKVTWLGYDIYWTPHAELYHFESKTRDASVHAFEVAVAWGRWSFRMHDPRYWPYPLSRPPR